MLFIICGHGAGDPGACGNGYTEAERVRALASRIKELGGADVVIGDMSKNWYKSGLVNNTNIPKGSRVLELHMDSGVASAKGAHVIIDADFEPDAYDKALATFISSILPGRSQAIVKRNDLANPNRAQVARINYRLLECGFISNAGDVEIFNSKMDEIAKGILECFGIGAREDNPASNAPTTPTNTSTNTSTYTGNSIVDYLNGIGKPSDFASRKKYAAEYGILNYAGTAAQNLKLLQLMRGGSSASVSSDYYPKYAGSSYGIDTVFAAIGVPETFRGSWKNRKTIAEVNGISNYTGTATQNMKLIGLAKSGKLKRV